MVHRRAPSYPGTIGGRLDDLKSSLMICWHAPRTGTHEEDDLGNQPSPSGNRASSSTNIRMAGRTLGCRTSPARFKSVAAMEIRHCGLQRECDRRCAGECPHFRCPARCTIPTMSALGQAHARRAWRNHIPSRSTRSHDLYTQVTGRSAAGAVAQPHRVGRGGCPCHFQSGLRSGELRPAEQSGGRRTGTGASFPGSVDHGRARCVRCQYRDWIFVRARVGAETAFVNTAMRGALARLWIARREAPRPTLRCST